MEFRRNRENKIADALKKLKEQRLSLQFPQLCKEYDEYNQLRDLQRHYETAHARLLEKLSTDISNENLKADSILKELFGLTVKIPTTTAIVERARLRCEVGNPPGKSGSLGDAINWEALLEAVPSSQDLYFVTDDRDYCSPLDESRFDPFLIREWIRNKSSQLFFYNRLSAFFKERFPQIKLASEYEKDSLIIELASSRSFAQTHAIIARLQKYADFTIAQINEILSASVGNRQVYWIIEDKDVMEFITGIIRGKEDRLERANLQRLVELLTPSITTTDEPTTVSVSEIDDIPF
jgi:hypothetical protein